LRDGSALEGGTETILLVVDEDITREATSELLSGFGYRVLQAASGEEALQIHEREQGNVQLVLTDLGMPGMGGEALLTELSRLNPGLKLLVASGYAGMAKSSGVQKSDGFLAKPFTLPALLGLLREVLDREKETD